MSRLFEEASDEVKALRASTRRNTDARTMVGIYSKQVEGTILAIEKRLEIFDKRLTALEKALKERRP